MAKRNISPEPLRSPKDLHYELRSFCAFDRFTDFAERKLEGIPVRFYENEFWTSKQRAGHSIHEISYRACYKPQLPAFFIQRFCQPGDLVYDPFLGRGTTAIEACLHGCRVAGNDINPLSRVFTLPRLNPPSQAQVEERAGSVPLGYEGKIDPELLVFFHEDTLREIYGWRCYFDRRSREGTFDATDGWIQMVAANRLTGHSPGFFSVYTLPPNQATYVEAQRKINAKRNQVPPYRDTRALIVRKSKQLLKDPLPSAYGQQEPLILCGSADATPKIKSGSVRLVVTSPPFLDTVDYAGDNWLRNWFCGTEVEKSRLWQMRSMDDWIDRMTATFRELNRVLSPDGMIAFEVGEVRKATVRLEMQILQAGIKARLVPELVMINSQEFTKTANCWGVTNNSAGTNSNRIVVFRKA